MKFKNILVTGSPGCGKTTLIERVIERLHEPLSGFITREIREMGRRVGFSIETLDGKTTVLAHTDFRSPHKVGKYGVRLEAIDKMAVPSLEVQNPGCILVIDEIGKMECISALFRKSVLNILDSPQVLLGSIALKGDAFIREIRARNDILIFEANSGNRNQLVGYISETIRRV